MIRRVALVGLLFLLGSVGEAVAQDARSDSLRAAVLDRIRPAEPEAPPDPDAPPPAVEPIVLPPPQPGAPARPPPEVPSNADAFMRALLQLEGFDAATYEGDRAEYSTVLRQLQLFGAAERRARFFGEGMRLEADSSIIYDEGDGRIRTSGITDFVPERGDPVRSQTIIYDLSEARGTAVGAQTTYTEGGRWIVSGNLDSVEDGLLFGSATRFTSCDLDPPHSHFEAARLKVVADRVLVASSVRMYIEDVPVLWLPFIAQNLGTGRASGILTPTFSINDVVRTSTGYNRRISNVGFYWAMSDYSDGTLAMDWFSNNYTALQGSFRYRWARRFLDGTANVKHYWLETGRRELGLDTRHNWQISERSRLSASARFISNSQFVRENSFDPRETTQTVNSDAGLNRRFDWGTASISANRQQHLTEERTDTTLPSGNLSLSTMTLFSAPPQTARWYNNVSMSGSTGLARHVSDRAAQPDTAFQLQQASRTRTQGSARGSVGIGDFSVNGNIETTRFLFHDVPGDLFLADPVTPGVGRGDVGSGEVVWSTSLSYRQRLIGNTTLTPNVALRGSMVQRDTLAAAESYVPSPTRFQLGVGVQTELYGFYPGFGQFEAVRHKIMPSVNWSYAPEVRPTARQREVFGPTVARRQSVFTFGFNQTWEARVSEDAVRDEAPPAVEDPDLEPDPDLDPDPEVEVDPATVPPVRPPEPDDGLTRLPPSRVVTLLALQTGAVTYDVIQADSTGRFVDGFTTTSLSNTVSSDYLRGLSLSFTHDLFDDTQRLEGVPRTFSPHLSQLSLGFSLSHRSGAIRTLGRLFGADPGALLTEPEPEPFPEDIVDEGPFDTRPGFDTNRVIPGEGDLEEARIRPEGWEARLQYSLRRPRGTGEGSPLRAQTISGSLAFAPTAFWTVDWRTSYDVEQRRFNDHLVTLGRDLHEWEATFGFRQTAMGNWAFHFEVSLRANQDLRLDYEQRSLIGQP